MKLAQTLGHVLGVENQILPETESKGKERISESSQGMASNCGWAIKLVKKFLFDFVRIFSDLSKIVDKGCKDIKDL
jgi:hypothetical protein